MCAGKFSSDVLQLAGFDQHFDCVQKASGYCWQLGANFNIVTFFCWEKMIDDTQRQNAIESIAFLRAQLHLRRNVAVISLPPERVSLSTKTFLPSQRASEIDVIMNK